MKDLVDRISMMAILLVFSIRTHAADLPVGLSENGNFLLKTSQSAAGLVILNTQTGEEIALSKSPGAGRYASISSDGALVCFKQIILGSNGERSCAPMLCDLAKGTTIALGKPSRDAGTPAIARNGFIAFTIENNLMVVDVQRNLVAKMDLGHHVNLLDISPDGRQVAYNDINEKIVIKTLKGGKKVLSELEGSFWGPKFSPSGAKLLINSVDCRVFSVDLPDGKPCFLGTGTNAAWLDDNTVAFVKKTVRSMQVVKTQLCVVDVSGESVDTILLNAGDANVVIAAKALAVSKSGELSLSKLAGEKGELNRIPNSKLARSDFLLESVAPKPEVGTQDLPANTVYITGVPTVHQVYDTPEWFNGHWACGATAASMALSYYGCLHPWDCWCRDPYSHTSPYGRYIAETYTYNGYTFDIVETDPSQEYATGGYGYITQNDWEDTKTHMAEYISYHGPSSYVDWSPTFAKACAEGDNSYPYVLLNSLTTAGHYTTGIGYYTEQYSLIFNDPYGNKNTTGYPSYDGTEVTYDWPGYNYGNENLNTVHCFIYARWSPQPTATPQLTPVHVTVDNTDPDCTLTGAWSSSTELRGWYGTNYAIAEINTSALATFDLDIEEAGDYEVYAQYPADEVLTTQAPYTVYHDGGTDTQTLDQQTWGGRWRLLGTYALSPGAAKVELSSNTGESGRRRSVIADAIMASLPGSVLPTPGPETIIDDGDAGYSMTGTWTYNGDGGTEPLNGDYYWSSTSSSETVSAEWRPNLSGGTYDVHVRYRMGTNRAVDAPYTIYYLGSSETVDVNQTISGGQWVYLGEYEFASGTSGYVKLANGPAELSKVVIADGVKFTLMSGGPTDTPTDTPTDGPTFTPSDTPTETPTDTPTPLDTDTPTDTPTYTPTQPGPYDDHASSESTVSGTRSGSYLDTLSADDEYEAITETESPGPPSNRYSYLEHIWTFQVTGTNPATLYVQGYHTTNSEGDDFVFSASTDGGSNYSPVLTLTKTSDDDQFDSGSLPAGVDGTVYIKVEDTDRTQGNRNLDTVYVDEIYVQTN